MQRLVGFLLLSFVLSSGGSGCGNVTPSDPRDNNKANSGDKIGKDGKGKEDPGTGGPNTGPNRPTK
jgi:hypothetical protein